MKRRGFTLIELLAAMAILAVVSVMSVQALGGVMQQRNVLGGIDERAAPLIRTLSRLRQDLESLIPPPAGTADLTAGLVIEPESLTLWRGGIADLPGAPGGPARVVWSVSGGELRRGGVVQLTGVTALNVTPLALPQDEEVPPERLAPGYEVILQTAERGALRLVIAR